MAILILLGCLDQSNPSPQRCQLIFCVECILGGYLVLEKTIDTLCQILVTKINCVSLQII
jgi:hypothetical protein